jgi:alkylhydroperoxidase/carboxymuconolactone decarboxylase family protein
MRPPTGPNLTRPARSRNDRDKSEPVEVPLGDYYKHEHLAGFGTVSDASPELGKKFFDWYTAVFAEGALTAREKSLIALAVAHSVQCPYCIDAYSTDCLEKGADHEQMTEALHVAAAIRGGASLVHGMQMKEVVGRKGM